jgi:hypothetical protein
MKTSATNILIDTGIGAASTSIEVAGKEASNLLIDDILRVYASIGNFDATVFGIGGQTIYFVAVMNVYFDSGMTVELYNAAGAILYTESCTTADWSGFENKNVYCEITAGVANVDRIRIYSTGGDDYIEKWAGYIWAGSLIDFGCIASCKPMSMSNDSVQISRTNHPDVNESYLYRDMDITTRKEIDFKTARGYAEQILTDGYGKGRPWILDEDMFGGECHFANLDSNKIALNPFNFSSKPGQVKSAQFTIGLREVT